MEEEEVIILRHFLHEHPLILIEKAHVGDYCRGCYMYFSGEAAYECSKRCAYPILLHEECAEMPREIRHPMHPHHILIQKLIPNNNVCVVCDRATPSLVYSCTNLQCEFMIHLGCAPSMGVIEAAGDEEKQTVNHDCHPQHELRLLRRSRRSCSFRCDACGTIENGNSYICSICEYWIHESCAFLPPTMERENLHHHPLSLSFHLPKNYIKFEYNCDICCKNLLLKHWVYHCESCSYVVHIKCAINASATATSSNS